MPTQSTSLPPQLADNIGFLLMSALRQVQRVAATIEGANDPLRLPHIILMCYLIEHPHSSQAELGSMAHYDKGQVAKLVAELASIGYITKAPSGRDARRQQLAPTRKGLAWIGRRIERARAINQASLQTLSERDHAQLISLLTRLQPTQYS